MIIYNVTIKISAAAEDEWLHWMQHIHMKEVVATGCFDEYQFFQLIEPSDEEGNTYVAQYSTTDMERYMCYINKFAPAMRQEGYNKFGDQFIAFRSVLRKM